MSAYDLSVSESELACMRTPTRMHDSENDKRDKRTKYRNRKHHIGVCCAVNPTSDSDGDVQMRLERFLLDAIFSGFAFASHRFLSAFSASSTEMLSFQNGYGIIALFRGTLPAQMRSGNDEKSRILTSARGKYDGKKMYGFHNQSANGRNLLLNGKRFANFSRHL